MDPLDPLDLALFNQVMDDLDDAEEQVERPLRELQIRHQVDPFEQLDENKFRKYFRVNKALARNIIETIRPFMQEASRSSAISIQHKVLTALRFFGFGSYQEITGTNKYVSLSQPSTSRAIKEVANALCQPQILNNWIHFPANREELQQLRLRFFQKHHLPGIVGCIDCTHVAIVRPVIHDALYPEHIYVNRKQYHSINVQLVCDENLKILNVNARFPGSSHDAYIWRQSAMSHVMEQIYRQDPEDTYFLAGDSGYPLRPWLMTPLRNPEPGPAERFNTRFISVRSLIERCNGVLKNRFRCLLKHRVLHYRPQMASKIINACVVLHNMCLQHRIPEPEFDAEMEQADLGLYNDDEIYDDVQMAHVNPDLAAARQLQQRIIHNHFN
ncbi:putative nuclease HARBI1 [Zophobas morio]